MTAPWVAVEPLDGVAFTRLRRRAIFDCCKWDPQVGDVCTIANVPLVLTASAWREVSTLAEQLAAEVLAAELEMIGRPGLHRDLGLPRATVAALAGAGTGRCPGAARIVRFDFHHTETGWQISEANTDVPGGVNEASGFALLMAPHYPDATPAGDVAGAYAAALMRAGSDRPHVALVHATAYTDDRQVMTYLARRLTQAGARASLISPAQLRWTGARAYADTEWSCDEVNVIGRFFPAEWLPSLPAACGWMRFFEPGAPPVSNPATAVLTQSKRFPLVWGDLKTSLPTWRRLLPETRDPRDVPWHTSGDWVLKPVLGRVGEQVAVPGVVTGPEWQAVARAVQRDPHHWAAQRRFLPTPISVGGMEMHPSLGVYAVDGRTAGAYGRLARRPLIDAVAMDAAVLVACDTSGGLQSPPLRT